jgi:hypothetical protein
MNNRFFAIAVYVLVAIINKQWPLSHSPDTILQISSLTLFENVPILRALAQPPPIGEPLDLTRVYSRSF